MAEQNHEITYLLPYTLARTSAATRVIELDLTLLLLDQTVLGQWSPIGSNCSAAYIVQ